MPKIEPTSRSERVGLGAFAFFFDGEEGATSVMSSWHFITDADIGDEVAQLEYVTEPPEQELGVTTREAGSGLAVLVSWILVGVPGKLSLLGPGLNPDAYKNLH